MDKQTKTLITISMLFLALMIWFNDNLNMLIFFWFLFIWSLMFVLTLAIESDLKWNRKEIEKELKQIKNIISKN